MYSLEGLGHFVLWILIRGYYPATSTCTGYVNVFKGICLIKTVCQKILTSRVGLCKSPLTLQCCYGEWCNRFQGERNNICMFPLVLHLMKAAVGCPRVVLYHIKTISRTGYTVIKHLQILCAYDCHQSWCP